jgi:hypothetical protein
VTDPTDAAEQTPVSTTDIRGTYDRHWRTWTRGGEAYCAGDYQDWPCEIHKAYAAGVAAGVTAAAEDADTVRARAYEAVLDGSALVVRAEIERQVLAAVRIPVRLSPPDGPPVIVLFPTLPVDPGDTYTTHLETT